MDFEIFKSEFINYLKHKVSSYILLQGETLFEYDIQHFSLDYLRYKLNSTKFKIVREQNDLTDICIVDKENEKVLSKIEIKTFIKPNEILTFNKVEGDLLKLSKNSDETCDKYLLIVYLLKNLSKKDSDFIDYLNSRDNKYKKKSFIIIGKRKSRSESFIEKKEIKYQKNQVVVQLLKIK